MLLRSSRLSANGKDHFYKNKKVHRKALADSKEMSEKLWDSSWRCLDTDNGD